MNKIIEDLNWRYATKRFDSTKKVSDSDLQTIKESLRLTATSYGLQAMKFYIIESEEVRKQLIDASYGQHQVADASHLIALCAYKSVNSKDAEAYMQLISETRNVPIENLNGFLDTINNTACSWDETEQLKWTSRQTYIALGNLLQTCAALRIDSTPMEGFQVNKVDEILGLSETNFTTTLLCPVGYRHEEDKAQFAPKVRKPLSDLFETI